MASMLTNYIRVYGGFTALFLWTTASACKNKAAGTHLAKTGPKSDTTTFESNDAKTKHDTAQTTTDYQDRNRQGQSEEIAQVEGPLRLTLHEATMQAGAQQSIKLEMHGQTEGYMVKSISVGQNGTSADHTKKFGVDILKNKSIPSSGLPITLIADPRLKAGAYALKIKIGKTGKDSRKTEKWITCAIHITEKKENIETYNAPYSKLSAKRTYAKELIGDTERSNQSAPVVGEDLTTGRASKLPEEYAFCSKSSREPASFPLSHKEIGQHDGPTPDKQPTTTPVPPTFALNNLVLQRGTQQSTRLAVTGSTEGYMVKSTSFNQNGIYRRKKIGIDIKKNQPIPSSGLPITITTDPTIKTETYELKIKIGKSGKGSRKTEQWVTCMIDVIEGEEKNTTKVSSRKCG